VTDPNRRLNIQAELRRGDESLRAADALEGLGLWADAVSRAYYAAFHHVTAMLLSAGFQARTHEGTHDLFYLHFVRPAALPPYLGKWLSALQRFRQEADYSRSFQFTPEGAREELDHARELCARVRERLASEGWIAE
jgi:uncharacterized protein (UPF0332 family)